MRAKLPLVLSITALIVSILGFTSVGEAAKNAILPPKSVGPNTIKRGAAFFTAAKTTLDRLAA